VLTTNRWLAVVVCAVVCLCLGARVHAADKPKFVIVTEGKVGFKEGDTFYPIGMAAKEFEDKFGLPDRKRDNE
jgi:hypothetical protein